VSSMASLSRVISGLNASQTGLEVTGHNLANANTAGYVRQQVLQNDSFYMVVGRNGKDLLSVGAGTDVTEIRQIRDEFLDKAYRTQISSQQFYKVQYDAVMEIETILGEVDGESFSGVLRDFWGQLQNLSTAPQDQSIRTQFIQSASVLVDKVNYIDEKLTDYQNSLNLQIKEAVGRINYLAEGIKELNEKISKYEIGGDRANDLRDQRNNLLDELAQYIEISYKEDKAGRVDVLAEGHTLVSGNLVSKITTTGIDSSTVSSFIKPVWEADNSEVIRFNKPIGAEFQNDTGKLKALLLTRGNTSADYRDTKDHEAYKKVEPYLIPRIQAEFDRLIHDLTIEINKVLTSPPPSDENGEPPKGLDGEKGVELFIAKETRDGKLYSAGNIIINPILLDNDGYKKLGLSYDGTVGDTQVVQELLDIWKRPNSTYDETIAHKLNFEDYYSEFVTRVAEGGNKASQKMDEKQVIVTSITNNRSSISDVSTDEEMTNLIKYQHAYNASARMVNIIDSMIDTIVNRTGLVGR